MYEHIKEHAIAYHVSYCDETIVDTINIRRATHKAMHDAIKHVIHQLNSSVSNTYSTSDYLLCIDGNDFTPYIQFNQHTEFIEQFPHRCITSGDNIYAHIAAASILAKVERDAYIEALCIEHPYLDERYSIASNKGYGAQKHMDGIRAHGISQWHRKSFGICKTYS